MRRKSDAATQHDAQCGALLGSLLRRSIIEVWSIRCSRLTSPPEIFTEKKPHDFSRGLFVVLYQLSLTKITGQLCVAPRAKNHPAIKPVDTAHAVPTIGGVGDCDVGLLRQS